MTTPAFHMITSSNFLDLSTEGELSKINKAMGNGYVQEGRKMDLGTVYSVPQCIPR
jgi:hypothetical protein